jgi:hypothetical protein
VTTILNLFKIEQKITFCRLDSIEVKLISNLHKVLVHHSVEFKKECDPKTENSLG